ncbi:MAG: hypothetical protein IH932_00070 [Thaumarchaeota archaeon]|nr:hypothetical protein [Nitrososphaerota archaeon]
MVKVEFEKDNVVFRFIGLQKFLAMKHTLSIPRRSIVHVSTEKVTLLWYARRFGTHIPKIFMAGTFWIKDGKSFWYVKNRSKCITLNLKNHEYSKVVVEVDDKESTADRLTRSTM